MTETISNTFETPVWLNLNFIEKALRQGYHQESLRVSNLSIRPATNVGDNNLSQMFRALVTVERQKTKLEDVSLIIKSMPVGEETEKLVNDGQFFERETKMFLSALPSMQEILNEIGERKICSKLYYHQGPPNNVIIFEDLCLEGYKLDNRLNCMDLAHSCLVAESLAVFHASSLVAIEKHPKMKEAFADPFWQVHNEDIVTKYMEDGLKTVLECLESWKNLPAIYTKKLEKLKKTGHSKLYKSNIRREDEINVLNHGDPWTSNLMFNYSNGIPKNCVFVDFQLSFCSSPVLDLLYFVFTSTKNELRVNAINDILAAYHIKFLATCKKLNYSIKLSFEDLKEAFFNRLFYGFFIQLILFPFMISPSKDLKDLNEYLSTTERPNNMIHNVFFKKTVETTFPYFLENGVFD